MILHLVKISIFRKEFRKMLRSRESIEICKHHITFNMTWIGNLKMFRIGIHAVHLLLDLLGSIGEIDAVAKRLGHLGLSIRARKTAANCILRE